ncbi:helix-turn-helix domain-containing protein [Streptomyces sp. NBC_01622]|uniref:helix-turn-helix domain-containing protein n=1 Tax=Streptomyces sp. NBC_01622 TaxID=2975903 RepID=UPI00386B2244|nr:helix-turn-helix domain-containing protein [Streptomyces sp. NBC_01622]
MTGAVVRERRTPPEGLGPLLRSARERAGLGLREAAREAGVSSGYLANLEAGTRSPSATVASRIADALSLDEAQRGQLLTAAVTDAGADHPARRRAAVS